MKVIIRRSALQAGAQGSQSPTPVEHQSAIGHIEPNARLCLWLFRAIPVSCMKGLIRIMTCPLVLLRRSFPPGLFDPVHAQDQPQTVSRLASGRSRRATPQWLGWLGRRFHQASVGSVLSCCQANQADQNGSCSAESRHTTNTATTWVNATPHLRAVRAKRRLCDTIQGAQCGLIKLQADANIDQGQASVRVE